MLQSDESDERTPHIVFVLEFCFATLVAAVLFGASFLIANFYDNIKLQTIIQLYSLIIILNSLSSVPLALFKRDLNFRLSSRSEFAFILFSSGGRCLFAFSGFGAVSYPLGDLLGHTFKIFTTYFNTSFRPKLSVFKWNKAKNVLQFGGYTSLSSVGAYLANQTDKILISYFFPVAMVGFYNFGYSQSGMFYNLIQTSQNGVFISLFAKYKEKLDEAREALLKINLMINFLALPFYTFIIINAELFIKVVFTEKWLDGVLFFQIFAADYFIRSFMAGITGIQISFGLAREAAITKLINSAIFVLFLSCAVFFRNIYVYALFYLLGTLFSAIHNFHMNAKVIELRVPEFVSRFGAGIVAISLTILLWLPIHQILPEEKSWFVLLLSVSCFGSFYFLISYFVNKRSFLLALQMVKNR